MSSEQLKPFQPLMDELAAPENRPFVPPLDPAFQQQLRTHLLAETAPRLSRQAVGRLWQFAATAVLLLVLGLGLVNFWLTLGNEPAASPPTAVEPTAAPTEPPPTTIPPTPTATAGQPLLWETAVLLPLPLGDGLQIAAIDTAQEQFAIADTIQFTLTWASTTPPSADYISFVHLFDNTGQLIAQQDTPLGPTADWTSNSRTTIAYRLPLPNDSFALPYQLVVGLYDSSTGRRLSLPDGNNTALLAHIQSALIEARISGTRGNGVTLRHTPDGETVAILTEGTAVNLLPAATIPFEAFDWQQVETEMGQVGWVPTRFLAEGVETAVLAAEATACLSQIGDTPRFTPSMPFPDPIANSDFWLGSDALWTSVPPDYVWRDLPEGNGRYTQKVFWWSNDFDATAEPNPDIHVTGRRLDGDVAPLAVSPPTHGFSNEIGSFMLTGVTFSSAGCWEVTGQYKEATLSFIVWVEAKE